MNLELKRLIYDFNYLIGRINKAENIPEENIKKYFNEKKAGISWLDLLGDIEFMEYMANITGKNYLTNFKIDEYNNKIFYGVSFGEV